MKEIEPSFAVCTDIAVMLLLLMLNPLVVEPLLPFKF
jgi:hypothetical protein